MTYWKDDDCIAITKDPLHKRKGLYIGNRYCIQRVATFSSDEFADGFDKYFAAFLGLAEGAEDADVGIKGDSKDN